MGISTNASSGTTLPVWPSTTGDVPEFPTLDTDREVDACIVGAGIAGLTLGYLLGKSGKSVAVLEDGVIVSGESQRTTAHISNALDDRYVALEKLHGAFGSKLAASSHTAAIDEIERIVRNENIDCDFERVDGYLFVPEGESTDILEQEMEAAHRAGLAEVRLRTKSPLEHYDLGTTLHFPQQAQFHPLKYLYAVARAIERDGGRIFQNTHATLVKGGAEARVEMAAGHVIRAASIAVATNAPINDNVAIYTRQAPYRTYVIGMRIPKGSVRRALYWDTQDPYHYVRTAPENDEFDILVVGGEDHKTGQADDGGLRFARLETWTRKRFPQAVDVAYRWSGQVMQSVDGLAFIGRNPLDEENVFIATGDSGNGITHGTIAGMLLRDLMLDRKNTWQDLYDPGRVTVRGGKKFLAENANVAGEMLEWIKPGESGEHMQPDTGRVIRRGLKRIALYCDRNGEKHELSAVCPHKGCIVAWNPTEKSWDCPCHGSRYTPEGKVVNGPSNADLAPAE